MPGTVHAFVVAKYQKYLDKLILFMKLFSRLVFRWINWKTFNKCIYKGSFNEEYVNDCRNQKKLKLIYFLSVVIFTGFIISGCAHLPPEDSLPFPRTGAWLVTG